MLTCPVCRSQNMDTAKFCGNCGTPFPRSPVPSSSLVNCAQGHIYSAVYEHCPYCPQSDQAKTGGFETRIEGSETVIETGGLKAPTPSSSEFETRLEGVVNPFETKLEPMSNDFATRLEPNLRAPVENNETVVEMRAPNFDHKALEETALMPAPETTDEATIVDPPKPIAPPKPVPVAPPKPAESPKAVDPTPPRPTGGIKPQTPTQQNLPPSAVTQPQSIPPQPPPPQPAPPQPAPVKPAPPPPPRDTGSTDAGDRRTTVMAAPVLDNAPVKGKGKIIGWLITYSKDQNGVDFRLYAGFNRIGAHPACDIVVDDDTVSGSHALIVYRDGRCMIKDELSRNGTYLNGVDVTESKQLQNYDQIRVGNTTLTYIAAERPS